MLMYGELSGLNSIANINNNIKVYNFTSLVEYNCPKLLLIPPNSLGANTEYEFDVNYMHWILDNDNIFFNFMQLIMDIYNGFDVYLLVSKYSDWSSMLTESLLKLIQQRYCIYAVYINNIEDFINANDSTFEDYGVINLDQDKERYSYISESIRINMGGQIGEGVPNNEFSI